MRKLILLLVLLASPMGDIRADDYLPKPGDVTTFSVLKPGDEVPMLADPTAMVEFARAMEADDLEGFNELLERKQMVWTSARTKVRVLRYFPDGLVMPPRSVEIRVLEGPHWKGKTCWVLREYLKDPRPQPKD